MEKQYFKCRKLIYLQPELLREQYSRQAVFNVLIIKKILIIDQIVPYNGNLQHSNFYFFSAEISLTFLYVYIRLS